MNFDDETLLRAKIAQLLHMGFVRLRFLSYPPAPDETVNLDEINDLADLLHNLPLYLVGLDDHAIDSQEQLRNAVIDHVKRFYPNIDAREHRFVQMLEMNGDEFNTDFARHLQHAA